MIAPGTRLGRYEIVAPLGAGGMGEVYRATDSRLGRDVAVKVLPEPFAHDPARLSRFEREARAVAALSHPNILAIHDYGTEQGISFAVMELLEGQTLRQRLAGVALPWREALDIAAVVADGLAAAHARGIIHRDLKPENLFLTADGRVKILDFGLARVEPATPPADETGSYHPAQTNPGLILGTIGYMSPEQVRGEVVDPRSDLFSLGCVVYEMIAGRRPFARATRADVLAAVLHDDPPPLGPAAGLPAEVGRLVRGCLAKDLRGRPESAQALAAAFRAAPRVLDAPGLPTGLDRPPRPLQAIDSLAVLPLANARADPDAEYLSDGLTESLINSLSQLPKLRVMARNTVFRYKDPKIDAQVVGQELRVRAVLTGRIQECGDSVIIAVELVDSADGSLLWGERYNRKLSEILTVQEEIAAEICEKLQLRLSGAEKERLSKRYTDDTEAYQLYLRGRYYWNKRTAEGVQKGIPYFQQAIEKDPLYALAHVGLADSYTAFGHYGILSPRKNLAKARAAAAKALEIDDRLAEAHTSQAWVTLDYDWNWREAEKSFRRAIELNNNYPTGHHWYALLLSWAGRHAEAIVEVKRAQELDPLSLIINTNVGSILYFGRQYDKAIEQYREALQMEPCFALAHESLALAYERKEMYEEAVAELQTARLSEDSPRRLALLGYVNAASGHREEARKLLDELTELGTRRYVRPSDMALIYAALGQNDQAFERLQEAYEERDNFLLLLKVEPLWDSLRTDARFPELLLRMKFPL